MGYLLAAAAIAAGAATATHQQISLASGTDLAPVFARRVTPALAVPLDEQTAYAQRLNGAFVNAGISLNRAQYVLLVDRDPRVQAALLYWRDTDGSWLLIGATPASTGRRGGFEHFLTPLGVFEHSLANPDFRAEGTCNALGIRGYGVKGMRVFDFGWALGERTWGRGGTSPMRLQVHATDPQWLEPRLGQPASKGCIRIPAALNHLLDHYGLLNADYDAALERGAKLWVLPPDREPTPWPGRYLVVVESGRKVRPAWAVNTAAPPR